MMRALKKILVCGLFLFTPLDSKAEEKGPVFCMAEAIYFEARGEPDIGQIAVGMTIRNRAFRSLKYPANICEVVRQGRYLNGNPVRNKCQFSYWCDGKPERVKNEKAWKKAVRFAKIVLSGGLEIVGLEKITHYHTKEVSPKWSQKLIHKVTIGSHKFYASQRQNL
tara:strand:+ start:20994 stop:21491 length:498 start_codon:yes stop_codon:yes gene_type:complete